jgi:hypothetical protein
METEDGYPRYDLELYRQSSRYSGSTTMTCAQGVIDMVETSRLLTILFTSMTFHSG